MEFKGDTSFLGTISLSISSLVSNTSIISLTCSGISGDVSGSNISLSLVVADHGLKIELAEA